MGKMTRMIILSVGVFRLFGHIANADEISFELKLRENRVSPGRQTYCEMIFHEAVPAPEAPFVEGLNIKHVTYDTGKTSADGRGQPMSAHAYRIVGQKSGSFTIGPVIFEYNGNSYRSNVVTLDVISGPFSSLDESADMGSVSDDISKHIYLTVEVPKTTIYVNERSSITLRIYRDWFNVSGISGGEIQGDDLIIDGYAEEDKVVEQNDVQFKVIRRESTFSAPIAGCYTIKPVAVSMDLISQKKDSSPAVFGGIAMPDESDFADMFAILNKNAGFYKKFIGPSGRRQIKLSASPVAITVLPFPKDNRPENFAGAVGEFSFDITTSAAEVNLGGQITLTMTIRGNGNYSTVSIPHMKKLDGIKLYAPRTMKGENSVIYEQAIRVQSADVKEIPEIVLTFFNPISKQYMSIARGPIPIHITAAAISGEKERDSGIKKEWVDALNDMKQPLRCRRAPFYLKRAFLIFETIPILIVLAGLAAYGIARYLRTHPLYVASFVSHRRAQRGMIKAESLINGNKSHEFYEHVFRMLQEYLGTRRLITTAGITGHIVEEIDTHGIEEDVIDRVREVFDKCYIARYTQEAIDSKEMRKTLSELAYAVDHLNRKAKL